MDQIKVGEIIADLTIVDKTDEALVKARRAMELIQDEIKRLQSDLRNGSIDIVNYTSRFNQLDGALSRIKTAMQGAFARPGGDAIATLNAKLSESHAASGRAAMGLMQLGYVIDDLQYSVLATVNNIGPMAAAFGAGAGLAGGLQVAAVAASQLYQNWDQVRAAFGDTSGIERARQSVEGMKDAVAELTTAIDTAGNFSLNPFKAGVAPNAVDQLRQERARLAAMQDREAAVKEMQAAPDEQEKKARDRFRKIVSEFKAPDGGVGGVEGLARMLGDQAFKQVGPEVFLNSEDRKRLAEEKAIPKEGIQRGREFITRDERAIAALEQKAQKAAEDNARKTIGRESLSEAGRQQYAARLAGTGLPGMGQLSDLLSGKTKTPEEQKKANEEAEKRAKEEAKNAREAAKAWEAADREQQQAEEKADREQQRRRKEEDERNRQFRRDNLNLAGLVMPDLTTAARKAQDAIDAGGNAGDEQLSLAARLERAGMAGPDAALAAKDALAEQAKVDPETRRKRREQEAEQARRERERGAREAIGRGEDRIPGLKDRVEEEVAAAAVGGGRLADVKARIAAELMRTGAANGEEEAMAAADQLATEGRKSVAEKVRGEAMKPREQTYSQTMEASDLARTAQAGVKNDETGKKFDRMIELLAEGVKNGQNVMQVRID